ncbi:MAG: hypothetical protein KFB93_04595 [Simkaniaceae bacterium]|nr:MAG: hypothetical protein KFB93_04595 [Simkaniaceae bacterium]
MNQITSWNQPFLQGKLTECSQKIALYETLRCVSRVGLPLIALASLGGFLYLNPSYLHIASSLLFFGYYPSMQVTVGTLERWVSEVRDEENRYRAISGELTRGFSVFQAQINALRDLPPPSIDAKERECAAFPSSEILRLELLDLKRTRARITLINARRHVEIAYVQYIERNPEDLRSLSDFGTFKTWPIDCLLNDQLFTVFISTAGRVFTNLDNFSEIFN